MLNYLLMVIRRGQGHLGNRITPSSAENPHLLPFLFFFSTNHHHLPLFYFLSEPESSPPRLVLLILLAEMKSITFFSAPF